MAQLEKQEACQLFIEQEIDRGLEEGKTPYSIGMEMSAWVEKLFEAKVKPNTIAQKAGRRKKEIVTIVTSDLSTGNDSQSAGNQEIKTHGGKREGAGRRPLKYKPEKNKPQELGVNLPLSRHMVSPEFTKAFEVFLGEIVDARRTKWEVTSKEAVLDHLGY